MVLDKIQDKLRLEGEMQLFPLQKEIEKKCYFQFKTNFNLILFSGFLIIEKK